MKDAVVVPELEVGAVYLPTLAFLGEDLGGFHDLLEEHRALPLRSRGEEVEVLPQGAAHSAWDAHEVMQAGQPATHRGLDEVWIRIDPRPGSHHVGSDELDSVHLAPHHDAAEALVSDQDVCPLAQQEMRHPQLAKGQRGPDELVGGSGSIESVRRPPDSKGRKGCQWDVLFQPTRTQPMLKFIEAQGACHRRADLLVVGRGWLS